VIMNDGSPTFLSSPNFSSSVIDLTIVSRPLAILTDVTTTQDLHDSDHFPVRILVRNVCSSYFRHSYKLHFSAPNSFYFKLACFKTLLTSYTNFLANPLLPSYKNMSVFVCSSRRLYLQFSTITVPLLAELESHTSGSPPRGGTIGALRLSNTAAPCAGFTNPIPHGTIGRNINVATPLARERRERERESLEKREESRMAILMLKLFA